MNARSKGWSAGAGRASVVLAAALAGCNMADDGGKNMPAPAAKAAPERQMSSQKPEERPARARLDEIDALSERAAPAKPGDVTRSWFAGSWTDSGDCADAGRFAPNGTYLLADGTRGMWSVQDGHLVVQHKAGRHSLRLRRIDQDNVELSNEDGTVGRSTRCS